MLGTKSQYAAKKGFSKAYLSKRGVKTMLEAAIEIDPADGKRKLNFEKADALFEKNRDPSRYLNKPENRRLQGPAEGSFEDAKRQRELLKLEREQMDLLERKGQTLSRQAVEDAFAAAGHILRDELQARTKRSAEKASTMKDARAIQIMLDEQDRAALQAMTDALKRKLFPDNGGPETTH